MAQRNIDFGAFPDDPDADAIRSAFQKTQENFTELFNRQFESGVTSINRTPGRGTTVNRSTGDVVVSANIDRIQFATSTLRFGIGGPGTNTSAVYTNGTQVVYIDLPTTFTFTDLFVANSITAGNNITANNAIQSNTVTAVGNVTGGNIISGGNLLVTSGNATIANVTVLGQITANTYQVTTANITNLNVSSSTNLGSNANVIITGGNNNQVLTTNGSGNLFWSDGGTGAQNLQQVTDQGNTTTTAVTFSGGISLASANLTGALRVSAGDIEATANVTAPNVISDNSNIGNLSVTGTANLGTVGNLTIIGGSNSQVLTTDGSGGLSWSTVQTGIPNRIENGTSNVIISTSSGPAAVNVNGSEVVQFVTDGLEVTGNANVTGIFNGDGGGLSNVTGANVTGEVPFSAAANSVAGGNVTGAVAQATSADSANAVAGANVSGQVANAAVADSATTSGTVTTNAQPNITSLGTLSSLEVTGNIDSITGIFNGDGGGLSNISAGNVTGIFNNIDVNGPVNIEGDDVTIANGNVIAEFFFGNVVGNISGNIVVPGANTEVLFNNEGNAGASANLTFDSDTQTLSVTGIASATTLIGEGGNISNITGANVTGEVAFAGTANSVAGANVSGQVANAAVADSATTAGTVTTNAQPNITSVGTLTGLTVGGSIVPDANVTYDLGTPTASFRDLYLSGNSIILGGTTIGSDANGALTTDTIVANTLVGDGTDITSIAGANVTGEVSFAATSNSVAGGNVSGAVAQATSADSANAVAGANVTGEVAFAGTANSVAGANVSGQVANAAVADSATTAGTVTTNAQPNITSVGTLTSITSSGNLTLTGAGRDSNLGNIVRANTFIGNVEGNISGNLVVPGQNTEVLFNNEGNAGASGGLTFDSDTTILTVEGNVDSANGIFNGDGGGLSNISAGNITGNISVPGANTQALFNNQGTLGASANFLINDGNQTLTVSNNVTASTFTGTLTTASQPNITSVGTLSTLAVTGNIDSATGIFNGDAGGLSNVIGANVTGEVSFAATSNSVAGANVSGEVAFAGTANSVAGANVTGQVNFAGIANSVAGANVSGAVAQATSADSANAVAGANVSGEVAFAATANSVSGGNVNGQVAFAATANSVAGANVTGEVAFAATANGVAGANVSGQVANAAVADSATTAGTVTTNAQPNITSVGTLAGLTVSGSIVPDANIAYDLGTPTASFRDLYLSGNSITLGGTILGSDANGALTTDTIVANTLSGDGTDITSIAGANVTGEVSFAATSNSVAGANVSGEVAFAATSNSVAGANVSGAVAQATSADSANAVDGANVSGEVAFAATANGVAGANVTGEVAFAATANGVAGANVSGQVFSANRATNVSLSTLGAASNVSFVLDTGTGAGSRQLSSDDTSNMIYNPGFGDLTLEGNITSANGVFTGDGGGLSNLPGMDSNFANFAGQVTQSTQSNITQVGDLVTLNVDGPVTINSTLDIESNDITVANGNVTADFFFGNVIGNISGNLVVPGSNTQVIFNDDGQAGASGNLTFNSDTQTLTAGLYSGDGGGLSNISGGNIVAPGGTSDIIFNNANVLSTDSNLQWDGSNLAIMGNVVIAPGTGVFDGDAAGLSNVNAIAITSGTLAQARLANDSITINGTSIALGGSGNITASAVENAATFNTTGNGNASGITFDGSNAVTISYNTVGAPSTTGTNASGTWGIDITGESSVAGAVTSNAQPNITSVGTLTSLTLATNGDITLSGSGSQITGANLISATNLSGNGATITDLNASNIDTGTLAQARLANDSITINGTPVALGGSADFTSNTSANITFNNTGSGNVSGVTFNGAVARTISYNTIGAPSTTGVNASGNWNINATTANTAGTITTNAQPNITSVGTLSSLEVTGNIDSISGIFNGDGGGLSNVIAANISGEVAFAATANSVAGGNVSGTVARATSADSANAVAGANVSGEVAFAATANSVAGGNVSGAVAQATSADSANAVAGANVTGEVSFAATANSVAGGNVSGAVAQATSADSANAVAGANVTGEVSFAATANSVAGANVSGQVANAAVADSATTAGTVTTNAQPNITSVGTLSSLSVTGTANTGTLRTRNLTTGANTTTGNITGTWSLTTGSSLEATYADLAEKYVADGDYEPSTVLVFGGVNEVTISDEINTHRVAGVVTTNPAYVMNKECEGEYVATIALQGRVPCKVIGPVEKGDLLVSAENGYAHSNNQAMAGRIIGKSLENFKDTGTGVIEISVGRT